MIHSCLLKSRSSDLFLLWCVSTGCSWLQVSLFEPEQHTTFVSPEKWTSSRQQVSPEKQTQNFILGCLTIIERFMWPNPPNSHLLSRAWFSSIDHVSRLDLSGSEDSSAVAGSWLMLLALAATSQIGQETFSSTSLPELLTPAACWTEGLAC